MRDHLKLKMDLEKNEKLASFLAALAITLSFVALSFTLTMFIFDSQKSKDHEIVSQIKSLNSIEKSIGDLQSFVKTQKNNILRHQKTLDELKKEKKELEPLVQADKLVIESLLIRQEKIARKYVWLERIIVFLIGVSSSIIGTSIYNLVLKKLKNKYSDKKIT